ncbi:hypothetical protein BG015_010221, partial [Linnemannia schmuckeri]
MAVLQALVEPKSRENREITPAENQQDNHRNLVMFSEFSGSLVGFFAFLIFGTTQDAFETLRRVVCCCRFGWCCDGGRKDDRQPQRRQERGRRSNSRDRKDADDTIYYYKDHENLSQVTIGSNDDNDVNEINSCLNYTELYLGNNDDGVDDYGYPISDNSLQLNNNNTFDRQFRINNNISSSQSEGSSITALATTTSDNATAITSNTQNDKNN